MGQTGIEKIRRLLWISTAVFGLLLMAIFAGQLWRDRENTLRESEARLHLLAHALAEHVESTLQASDAVLRSTKWTIESRGGLASLDEAALHGIFTRQLAALADERIGTSGHILFAVGPDGRMLGSSATRTLPQISCADREYFLHHQQGSGEKTFLSRLDRSPISGMKVIDLSIRLSDAVGDFAGVVGIALEIDRFGNFYDRLGLAEDYAITVFRTDGKPLLRHPFRDAFFDVDLAQADYFKHMIATGSGSTPAYASPVDGIKRLTGFHTGTRYPILAIATRTEDAALAAWRRNGVIYTGLALLAMAALLALLRVALRKIDEAQNATVIAHHDPLTGLPNRRYLDAHLQAEWRRMLRERQPLAVLFLDIDHFKRYNDHYGHAAGDACLRTVASCLTGAIRRGGDVVARYGGEEFIGVLPHTDAAGVQDMAQRFMASVAAAHLPHAASPTAPVLTVSIGYASTIPSSDTSPQDLLARADEALYAAKAGGRNRAVGA